VLIVVFLVPYGLGRIAERAMLETTLCLLTENNLIVQASEIFPRSLVIFRGEPVREVRTASIPIWKVDWGSRRDMALSTLLAIP
jgi:hypothetical protein